MREIAEIVGARVKVTNHQLSWWFDREPLKAVLKDFATLGWDYGIRAS